MNAQDYADRWNQLLEYGRSVPAADMREADRHRNGQVVAWDWSRGMWGAIPREMAPPGTGGVMRYDTSHAPAGGATVGGKQFKGGEFIPGHVLARATAAEKAAVKSTKTSPKNGTSGDEKATKESKWQELMASKSHEDRKHFESARKDGIAIPPAWTQVKYYGKDGNVFAEGRDDKGRRQRVENPEYRKRVSAENNARISKDLMPRLQELRATVAKDAAAGNEEAKVLHLILQTGFRIGGKGDGKSKTEAFGASTLMGKHAKADGDTVTFDFPGKKGVRQQHTIKDPVIAAAVLAAGPEDRIFKTSDVKVRQAWQEKYGGEKVHDIRHAIANEIAEREIGKRVPPPPKSERERLRLIKDIATTAARTLGNDPAQTLGTYIDPQIWRKVQAA